MSLQFPFHNLDCIGTAANRFYDSVFAPTFVNNLDTYNSTRIFLLAYKHGAKIHHFWAGTPKWVSQKSHVVNNQKIEKSKKGKCRSQATLPKKSFYSFLKHSI